MRTIDYSIINKLKYSSDVFSKCFYILKENGIVSNHISELPKSLTEIENIVLNSSALYSKLLEHSLTAETNVINKDPTSETDEIIEGYKAATSYIQENYPSLEIDEDTILVIHYMLVRESFANEAGRYKTHDFKVEDSMDFISSRRNSRIIKTSEIQNQMKDLVKGYSNFVDDEKDNPLFLIPCFILDFICISPFAHGNVMMSFLLAKLLLLKNGLYLPKYYSLEEEIVNNYSQFKNALETSQSRWYSCKNNYEPFIIFFINLLFSSYKNLELKLRTVDGKKANKIARIEGLILSCDKPISKKEIHNILSDVSITTIEKTLNTLMKQGIIQKIGIGKSSKYKGL